MSSGDPNEALKCLKELEVPHFHHELVYQVILDSPRISFKQLSGLRLGMKSCTSPNIFDEHPINHCYVNRSDKVFWRYCREKGGDVLIYS